MVETNEQVVDPAAEAERLLMGGEEEAAQETPQEAQPEPPAPKVEETPQEAPAEPEEDNSKTQLWARLTQQDKELRQLKQQLKTQTGIDKLRELAKKDPAKVLADLGMGIDQVLDAIAVQQGQAAPPPKPEASPSVENEKIAKLERELAEFRQQQYEAAVQAEVGRIDAAVAADPDRWEVVRAQKDEGSYRLVLETCAELWQQTGQAPDYALVLDEVEKHLAAEVEQKFKKLSSIKKFNKAPAAPATPAAKVAAKIVAAPKVPNPNAPTGTPRQLSEEEKFQKALELLQAGTEE